MPSRKFVFFSNVRQFEIMVQRKNCDRNVNIYIKSPYSNLKQYPTLALITYYYYLKIYKEDQYTNRTIQVKFGYKTFQLDNAK